MAPHPGRLIHPGDSGDDVRTWQEDGAYNLPVTGGHPKVTVTVYVNRTGDETPTRSQWASRPS